MPVADTAFRERASFARYRCEAHGLHHKDCPGGLTAENRYQFVLHHRTRRGDTHDPDYANRDDVENLRLTWNGQHGRLGAGGCHGEIHQNQRTARELDLLVPLPDLTNQPIGVPTP